MQAALAPHLFQWTPYGMSVWVEFLLQVDWQRRPVRVFKRDWAGRRLVLPASSLLGDQQDFVNWFAPLEHTIGVHQLQALLVHGDEMSRLAQGRGRVASQFALLAVGLLDVRCGMVPGRSVA